MKSIKISEITHNDLKVYAAKAKKQVSLLADTAISMFISEDKMRINKIKSPKK